MNHTLFCNSFLFCTIVLRAPSHTDNSRGTQTHYLARMKTGTGVIRILDGTELHLRAGDAFYLPLGLQYHSYWTPSAEGEKTVSWDTYGFTYLPTPVSMQYEAQLLQSTEKTDACFDFLVKNRAVSPASVGNLYLLFDLFSQTMKQKSNDPKQQLLEQIKQYLIKHPDCKIPTLAKHFNISESGIYKFVREYGNTTPIELKNHLLMQKAIQLLETTDLSVEEIGEQLGFCSAIYFRKIFKRETGKTPSELRRDYAKKLFM